MRNELYTIAAFILAIWLVFFVDALIPAALTEWGLRPRSVRGLAGIPMMPMLHGGFGHLFANTLPLIILLCLLAGSRDNLWRIVFAIITISGLLLWVFGRDAIHIGASALIFGLIAFLIASGIIERRFISLGISFLVGLMYMGTVLTGLMPRFGREVSWDGHLFGMIAGALVAYLTTSRAKGFFAAGDR
jgi:membrane associated rhomboid family serine protease